MKLGCLRRLQYFPSTARPKGQEFASRMFGSIENWIGAYYKMPDETRIQVVGVTQNGNMAS